MTLDFNQEPSEEIKDLIKTGLQKILFIHWGNYDIQIGYFDITKNPVSLCLKNERYESNHWTIHIKIQYGAQDKLETVISLKQNDLVASIIHTAAEINEKMYKKKSQTLNYRPLDFVASTTTLEKIDLQTTST